MGLRAQGVRWLWFAVVIVVTGWEAVRHGVSWVTLSPVAIAVALLVVAVAYRLREGVGDERTRLVTRNALAMGFVAVVLVGIASAALVVPHALVVSLDAGMVVFMGGYLVSRYRGT